MNAHLYTRFTDPTDHTRKIVLRIDDARTPEEVEKIMRLIDRDRSDSTSPIGSYSSSLERLFVDVIIPEEELSSPRDPISSVFRFLGLSLLQTSSPGSAFLFPQKMLKIST